MTEDLDALERLTAEREIIALLQDYCRFADRNENEALAECFTEDCVADYGPGMGPVRRGREARREDAESALSLFSATSHHLSNFMIEFGDRDSAATSCKLYAWHRPLGGGPDWELWAEYRDRVVRTAEGWKIASRRFLVAGEANFPAEWEFLRTERIPGKA